MLSSAVMILPSSSNAMASGSGLFSIENEVLTGELFISDFPVEEERLVLSNNATDLFLFMRNDRKLQCK